MLQVDIRHYASDILEDAMRLAQTKSLNSYTFSDCIAFLNYAWSDVYSRIAQIDDGYYGQTIELREKHTKLPKFVKSTVQVYTAQRPGDSNRIVYRAAGTTDIEAPGTYRLSGTDLYCFDVQRRKVFLYYVPQPPQLFFTHHNRDPVIYEDVYAEKKSTLLDSYFDDDTVASGFNIEDLFSMDSSYNIWQLGYMTAEGNFKLISADSSPFTKADNSSTRWFLRRRGSGVTSLDSYEDGADVNVQEITSWLTVPFEEDSSSVDTGRWLVKYITCDYPYIFVTYVNSITREHRSGFFDRDRVWNDYNPFDFTGRGSNVQYISVKWNDKTGFYARVLDWNDLDSLGSPKVKELGWTPDTLLDYPVPEVYRYLVARLADKLSALNESNVMGVQKELVESRYAIEAWLSKDKSSFKRIINVNPATIADWL